MKKILATMLLAGVLSVAACGATMYSAGGSKTKLESNGYSVSVYGYEDGKKAIEGPNYDTVAFDNAIIATKGSGDSKDVFLAFYFSSVEAASTFMSAHDNDNTALLYRFAERNLGSNFEPRMGTHNNVCWAGSQNAFNSAI